MLTFTVLSGFVFGLVAPALVQTFKARSGWAIAALPMALFVYLVSQFPNVANGQSIRAAWAGVPSLGLTLSFRLDGLGLLFALLISGIGALVMVYAGDYLKGRDDVGRFFV